MAKFFTKKVCLIILATVVAVGGIIWAIVANYTPKFESGIKETPVANYVSGNGTASVMVDNYLYFVGDSVANVKTDIKYGDNEYYAHGKMPDTGIFRVKIGEDNAPVLKYTYDNTYIDEETGEKGEWQPGDENYNSVVVAVQDWEHIGKKKSGIEAVVPKIAGHDKTALWVFDQYLIYTSPHNRYDNRGNLLSEYLDFFRVDLNGKNHTLIYTSSSTNLTTKNFTVWADSTNNIQLLVSESDNESKNPVPTIVKINVKTKKKTVLDSNVANVVLPMATQYGKPNEKLAQVYGGVMGYVYYTKDAQALGENSTLKGNLLYRCAVNQGKPEVITERGDTNQTINFTPLAVTPLDVDGAHASAQFVFSIEKTPSTGKSFCVMTNGNMNSKINLNNFNYIDHDLGLNENSQSQQSATVTIYANGFCQIGTDLYHYRIDDSRLVLDHENDQAKKIATAVDRVLAVMGDTVYVQAGNAVQIVNLNGTTKSVSIASTENTTDDESSTAANTLPVAVLYQPQGNTGDPLIFVQDANTIRLFSADQTYKYMRFKQS